LSDSGALVRAPPKLIHTIRRIEYTGARFSAHCLSHICESLFAKENWLLKNGKTRLVFTRMWPRLLTIALIATLISAAATLFAQNPANPDAVKSQVTLTELFPPAHPPLARQTRTSGDVQLDLKIRQDGSVDSLEVFSGHPLRAPAALDSAKQSHFRCANCGENLTAYRLVYTFQFVDTEQCCSTTKADLPEPNQTENHITVFARPTCPCDPGWTIGKVRSIKCFTCGTVVFASLREIPRRLFLGFSRRPRPVCDQS
jgi:hypothetical protein